MTDPILVVENVSKRFAGRIALESVSIDVARGSMTGVIGPNGSGKSTLFNIIAGTLRPDIGRVIVGGRDITRASPAEICGHGVARTFQISRLFAEMTVLENLVAVAQGRDDRAAIELAMELLEFLEITAIVNKWASELSYGQRKLVEIARALMLQPRICCSTSRSPASIRAFRTASSNICTRFAPKASPCSSSITRCGSC